MKFRIISSILVLVVVVALLVITGAGDSAGSMSSAPSTGSPSDFGADAINSMKQ